MRGDGPVPGGLEGRDMMRRAGGQAKEQGEYETFGL